jgi:hypothetical protein
MESTEFVEKGWFCPICEALIPNKRYESGIITCDCYGIGGSNVCMADSRKENIDPETGRNWYNFMVNTQKKWIRLYMKKIEESLIPSK